MRRIAAILAVAGLTVAMALPITPARANSGQPAPPRQEVPPGEHHPELHKADVHLRAAEMALKEATNHYGGHKDKAAELIRQAQEELRLAVQYSDAHAGER